MYYCITEKHNITIIYNFVRVVKTNVQKRRKSKENQLQVLIFLKLTAK